MINNRHFANAVRRLLGVQLQVAEHGHSYFDYNGRRIMASSSFMGIEPKVIQNCLTTDEYKREREELLSIIAGRKVIVSVAYLERLKGLPLQLQAIKDLLDHHPSLQHTLVFIIVYFFFIFIILYSTVLLLKVVVIMRVHELKFFK